MPPIRYKPPLPVRFKVRNGNWIPQLKHPETPIGKSLVAAMTQRVTAHHLETGRRMLRKALGKNKPFLMNVHATFAGTRKPEGVKMGKGRGPVSYFVARVPAGKPVFTIPSLSHFPGVPSNLYTLKCIGDFMPMACRLREQYNHFPAMRNPEQPKKDHEFLPFTSSSNEQQRQLKESSTSRSPTNDPQKSSGSTRVVPDECGGKMTSTLASSSPSNPMIGYTTTTSTSSASARQLEVRNNTVNRTSSTSSPPAARILDDRGSRKGKGHLHSAANDDHCPAMLEMQRPYRPRQTYVSPGNSINSAGRDHGHGRESQSSVKRSNLGLVQLTRTVGGKPTPSPGAQRTAAALQATVSRLGGGTARVGLGVRRFGSFSNSISITSSCSLGAINSEPILCGFFLRWFSTTCSCVPTETQNDGRLASVFTALLV
ncbi:unnamed protein product [Amoebophrya sp. A25]|nr:unnamed protein product [Amoebophrya sp. A25]|eukprot:GSA25T00024459001.1